MKNLDALAVEKKTASELAEMVATTIGISAAAMKVMPDPVQGWRVMVIGPRATANTNRRLTGYGTSFARGTSLKDK
jgi:hypothetical protein